MARKRKDPKDNKLPPRVSRSQYAFYLKTKDNKTITLGPLSMSMPELWARYEGEIANQKLSMTFSKLWSMYLGSPAFTELSFRSQKDKLKGGKNILKVFGHINADKIRPEHIRKYMDIRGTQSKVQANHELSYMTVTFAWGYERGYCKTNPCSGVKSFSIKSRDTYITDEEYSAAYEVAPAAVKIAMEIAYLCAARIGDVLDIRHDQLLEEGLYIRQGKTGVKQIKQWTERLLSAIDLARTTFPPMNEKSYLVLNNCRGKFSYQGFNNQWQETKRKASAKLGYRVGFTFHDLKAKGISDFEGSTKDKQMFSGHQSESQVRIYDRKTKVSPTLDKPIITE